MNDYNLFTLQVDNNELIDAVYFFITDHCSNEYKTATQIANELNKLYPWDVQASNVRLAVKQIRETATPRYAFEIMSASGKGYKLMSADDGLTAPMHQALGLIENISKSGKDLRLFYKKLNDLFKDTQVLAEGQQDFSGNVYRKYQKGGRQ